MIYDLLVKNSGPLELREDPDQGMCVAGLKHINVTSAAEIMVRCTRILVCSCALLDGEDQPLGSVLPSVVDIFVCSAGSVLVLVVCLRSASLLL